VGLLLHVYALAVASLGAALGVNAAGWAAGGFELEGTLLKQQESMIMAWPADDVLQAREFSPACRHRVSKVEGLGVEANWWYQAVTPGVWCWGGECPLTFDQQYLVGVAGGYECCMVSEISPNTHE
jgi:hypothetical protein